MKSKALFDVVILSEDQILEAISRYLRDSPFKYDFDDLEIAEVCDTEDGSLKLEVEIVRYES